MKKTILTVAFIVLVAAVASAQNPASNKAFFASSTDRVKLAAVSGEGWTTPVLLFGGKIPATVKTSNGGALSAILSMEASLWTYNLTTDVNLGGKTTSSSRAAIKAWVEVDGVKMEPGKVVYADRLQAVGLDLNLENLTCQEYVLDENGLPTDVCAFTDSLTLELFQRTKNANSFVFFLGPLDPTLHDIKVKAQGLIECRSNGDVVPCSKTILDGYRAKTAAAIGKASLLIEEQQNWGTQK